MLKFKKSVLFIVTGSLIFALWMGGRYAYFLLYSVALTVILSFIYTKIAVSRINVSQAVLRNYISSGEEAEIKTTIVNRSFLPIPYIEITNDMVKEVGGVAPKTYIISLRPFGTKCISQAIKCKYKGIYSIGPISAAISDVFGFFTWSQKIMCSGTLTVYPRVSNIKRFGIKPALMFGTMSTKQKANEDYSSISDIKKYYPGDSIKKIHWKVSARKGSLHIKNFDTCGSAEAYIFLNMFHGDYAGMQRADTEEKAVECAASVIYYMLANNISTNLYTNCKNPLFTKGRDAEGFKKFIDGLVRVKPEGETPLAEFLKSKASLMSRGASVVIVTPRIDQLLVDRILQLKELKFDVIIVYIMAENFNNELLENVSRSGVKLYKMRMNDDVRVSLEG